MKDAVILLLCAIALADGFELNADPRLRTCNCDPTEAEKICEANFGNDNVLIAHEYCDKFYLCSNGKPVAQNCPANLLYNPFLEQCEWPDNVDCGDRPISDGNETDDADCDDDIPDDEDNVSGDDNGNDRPCNCNPGEAPSICAAEGSNGILIAHENCNQFYTCDQGRPVTLNCPPTLLYNPYHEECDWPQNVECGDRVIPEPESEDNVSDENGSDVGDNDGTCNCNPEEAPGICAAAGSDGILVAHENCDQYYICNHGRPVAATCPNALLFNPYSKECDWARNVDCGDRIVPEGNGCSSCNEGDDVDDLPPPCDDSDNENDDSDELPPAGDDPGSDSGEVVVTPPSSNDPDDSGNDNNSTCNCNPEEAPLICQGDNSDGVLIAHENCNQFYKCDNGKPAVLNCPGKLLYDPVAEQCDWPENVDCGDRVMPNPDDVDEDSGNDNDENEDDGDDNQGDNNGGNDSGTCNCNPEEAPSICAAEGSDDVLIAHENCNQFYICDHGKPVALICPENLLYNPYKQQCDWSDNVECGDRLLPDPDDVNEDNGNGNENDDSDELPPAGDDPGSDSGEAIVTPPTSNDPDDSGNDNNGTCNCNPEEAPLICQGDNSDGVLIAHENCNQFYKCDHGKPAVLSCPGKLLYDPVAEQCDWPENVDCGDRVMPNPDDVDEDSGNDNDENEGGGDDNQGDNNGGNDSGTCNCNPEEAPSICAAEGSDDVLIAHENCNQFYICDHGKPVALNCPENLLYNPYKQQCDWSDNVECGDRLLPDPDDVNEDNGNDNENDDSDELPPAGDDPGSDSGEAVVTPPTGNNPDDSGNDNIGTCNCNPEEAPLICQGDNSDGVLIAHENCNQFYKCDHGKPAVLSCPGKLLYDPVAEQCDWPENVDCGDRVMPNPDDVDEDSGNDNDENEDDGDDNQGDNNGGNDSGTCNCNPEEAPSICAAEGSDDVLIAHENCNQFYICDHGKPVALNCPENLLYNPYKQQCDWSDNVDCGDRVKPDPEEDIAATMPPIDEDSGNDVDDNNSSDDEDLPPIGDDPGNNNNNSEEEDLPPIGDDPGNNDNSSEEDLPPIGDDAGNDGTNPDDSDCDNDTDDGNDTTCNCEPDKAPSICAVDNSDGVLIAHEYCTHFYKCDNGKAVPFKCGSDLLYNPIIQVCDWASNVECGDRVIPDPEEDDNVSDSNEVDDNDYENENVTCNCNPEEAPEICAVSGSDGIQIAHENCNQYYQCSFGRPVAMSCPSNLLYNPYIRVCDWPANVKCGDRVIPDPEDNDKEDSEVDDDNDSVNIDVNDDPSQAPAICADSGSNGVLVAHENCNQFYMCSGGSPVTLSCSGQLLFNPQTNNCDWPRNVDCGDRIVPGNDNDCACNPRNAPTLCARPDSHGKLIAHENCNQFYMCVNEVPVARDCPANLHYNIDKELCDWPQNVNCEMRMVSYSSLNKHLESRQALKK